MGTNSHGWSIRNSRIYCYEKKESECLKSTTYNIKYFKGSSTLNDAKIEDLLSSGSFSTTAPSTGFFELQNSYG
jgi:hypothetical protein